LGTAQNLSIHKDRHSTKIVCRDEEAATTSDPAEPGMHSSKSFTFMDQNID
jgi:hypothetical protein